ncbi:MDR family MFS transporter [Motilibacter deserti]|uniref:MDR family MFS transporter n=1 Tax=Motilibacter deserti TaxID=2714956 RepID=UPI002F2B455D
MTDTAVAPRAGTGLRGLPRPFWFLWAGTLVNRIGLSVQPFLLLYLTTARDLSAPRAGLVLTALGAGASCSQILGGALTDRVGRRRVLVGGLLASAGSLALLGLARGMPALLAAAVLVGVCADLYRPAASALVADLVSPERRTLAYSLLFWAINLGFAIAGVLAGWLATHGYGLVFALDAGTCAVFALIVWRGVPADPPRLTQSDESVPASAGYGTALRDPLLVALCVLTLLQSTVYMQGYVTLPLVMADDGLSPRTYGTVIALNGLGIVLLQPLLLRWLTRQDRLVVLAAASVLIGIGYGCTAFADTGPEYAATVLVWTVGEIGTGGAGMAIIADLAPPGARGRYQGLFGTMFGAAALTAPLVGTTVLTGLGEPALWGGCVALGLVVAVGMLALAPGVRARRRVLEAG